VNRVRVAVGALALSASTLVGLLVTEGYREQAYRPLPTDVWTAGFGTTGPDIQPGVKLPVEQALQRALTDVQKFEGAVRQCVKVPLHQHEYDAFVKFSYNVGSGAFCNSTMVRLLNAGDYAGACAQFDRWTMFQGKDCRVRANGCYGLVVRRQAERALCEGKTQ
jgi:lysozyme